VFVYRSEVRGVSERSWASGQHGRDQALVCLSGVAQFKYQEVYLHVYERDYDAYQGVLGASPFIQILRPHRALDGLTPDRVCW
jgi:hypothetical protein